MTDRRFQGLRAVLRNALTWAAAWGVAGGAIVGALTLFSPNPAIESLPERIGMALLAGVAWGVRFGLAGAVIGTAFATLVRVGWRGRRLADIDPVRFTLLGAVVGGVGVPLYLQMMNVLTGGHPIAWGLVTDDAVWATVFGATAAAGFIWLARRADARARGAGTTLGQADAGRGAMPGQDVAATVGAGPRPAPTSVPAPAPDSQRDAGESLLKERLGGGC